MSNNKRSCGNSKGSKRNLPSWMSSTEENENEEENREKKPSLDAEGEKSREKAGKSSFNKLLEGVVFVLSGFVNPERGTLRSHAIEMGAEYQPDWNSECTLLVCAFPNTPKFRQVEADGGTIVSKDWIVECYSQRKLIEIDSYLMHAGKPWRKGNKSHEDSEDKRPSASKRYPDHERELPSKPTASIKSKGKEIAAAGKCFVPSEVKKWAIDDLKKTVQWLESQEEKPDPTEITKIAAEGILTCLKDVISALEEKQDIQKGTEDWKFLPRVVEELAMFDAQGKDMASMSKEEILKQALECKRIYEVELNSVGHDLRKTENINKEHSSKTRRTNGKSPGANEYDSDETIEMTEQEIDLAYKTLSSKIH
ncbi:DNA-repair protein XRCC1 [Arachis duranensis]|uniref:DNA-repair protein XRCC1 n=1 Tax=Arachis duranensis TaxID=130453 RepID=A0A6P4D233_ARADU|nr:DNA-repair protein XRCC1 [Arachis duranensis]